VALPKMMIVVNVVVTGIPDGECDCDGNVEDCNGDCGGSAVVDECGVCEGLGCYEQDCALWPSESFDCYGNTLAIINPWLIPETYKIHNIYPNPFNPIANIIYGIPENAHIRILVFDIRGRQVAKLMDSFQFAGYHAITWDATSQPSGVYLVKILSGRFNSTQKVVLMK